jgi:hypothetical protein
MKVFAIIFTVLFVLLAYTIWFGVQMEGAGNDFWSDGVVQFTAGCFILALVSWIWIIVKKKKN